MTDYQKYINALRKCAKEHENDRTSTGHIIVSDLCRDTANLLEALEQEPCEDAISRQAVLDNAYAYGNGLEPEGYCVNVEDIQALPPVTPQQKKAINMELKLDKRIIEEAVQEAVNDIKQNFIPKDVLDKIKAEIKAMSGDIETIADVLAIIDKYKAESEE